MSSKSRRRRPGNNLDRRTGSPDRRQPTHANARPVTRTEVTEIIQQISWSGPIPRPEDLERYEQTEPGLARRIMAMAEGHALHVQAREIEQAKHRRTLETIVVEGNERRSNIGQFTAFFTALAGIGAGVWIAAITGNGWAGGATVATVFAGGALVWFLAGHKPYGQSSDDGQ